MFRFPIVLYRLRLGRLLGRRFLVIVHRGRRTGKTHATAIEVARYDPTNEEAFVVSAWGERSDWYRNLSKHRACEVWIGGKRWISIQQRMLSADETFDLVQRYRSEHPWAAWVLSRLFDLPHNGSAQDWRKAVDRWRAVSFRPGPMDDRSEPEPTGDILPVRSTRRETQRTYSRLAKFYDATEGLLEVGAKRRALELAATKPGEAVLEIGPGTGWALERLCRAVGPDGTVAGIDLAPGMIRQARRRLVGTKSILALGDGVALPFLSEGFDLVFMSFVVELFPTNDIARVLDEVFRVLRPGGRLCNLSLTRESPNLMTKIYELGHRALPSLVDCRPIHARQSIEAQGFEIVQSRRFTILGLPVEIVVAQRPSTSLPTVADSSSERM